MADVVTRHRAGSDAVPPPSISLSGETRIAICGFLIVSTFLVQCIAPLFMFESFLSFSERSATPRTALSLFSVIVAFCNPLLPGLPLLYLLAGWLFGWTGFPIAYFGSVLGGVIWFSVSRALAQHYEFSMISALRSRTCCGHKLSSLYYAAATAVREDAIKFTLMLQFSILPYAWVNSAVAFTQTKLFSFVIGTLLSNAKIAMWICLAVRAREFKQVTNATTFYMVGFDSSDVHGQVFALLNAGLTLLGGVLLVGFTKGVVRQRQRVRARWKREREQRQTQRYTYSVSRAAHACLATPSFRDSAGFTNTFYLPHSMPPLRPGEFRPSVTGQLLAESSTSLHKVRTLNPSNSDTGLSVPGAIPEVQDEQAADAYEPNAEAAPSLPLVTSPHMSPSRPCQDTVVVHLPVVSQPSPVLDVKVENP